jgi:2-methylisocitrate lyase-like PEP mutase family enzyme
MRHGPTLRRYFESGRILLSIGIFDPLSARIAEKAGAPSIYVTGYGAAATQLGVPDLGILTGSEMADHVRRIGRAVSCPIVADADTGYGGPANIARTVSDYESAGVDLIQIEDQEWPKRCGHMAGKRLVAPEEMIRRVRVAASSRKSEDFLIMARTDAVAVEGFDAAVERARAYGEAGADVLFVEAPRTEEDMARLPKLLDKPLMANMVEGGRTPLKSAAELEAMGFSIALFPIATLFAAAAAVRRVAETLVRTGTSADAGSDTVDFAEFNDLVGLDEYLDLENR